MQVFRDRQYGAALLAALFFWSVLLWAHGGPADLTWPLGDPLRFLLPALVYPVLEEATFRGVLQPAMLQRAWGAVRYAGLTAANVVTALLFAASHLVWHSWLQAMGVFVPGLIFGYFRDRYGRIGPSVILHVFYNAGFIWLIGSRSI